MPLLDFKEISQANKPTGSQDAFELFARDFFRAKGYLIEFEPSRGPDLGKDVILTEVRTGHGGRTTVRWLVSCKHHIHGGNAVGLSEEEDIPGRLEASNCHGFIGFYTPLASTSLQTKLRSICNGKYEIQLYDCEKIESELLDTKEGCLIASRYFPQSYNRYRKNNPTTPNLSLGGGKLLCEYCSKDLLENRDFINCMYVFWVQLDDELFKTPIEEYTREKRDPILTAYACCKGDCDRELQRKWLRAGVIDFWFELSDFTIPSHFILSVTKIMEMLDQTATFSSPNVSAKVFNFLISVFHTVSRDLTDKEEEIVGLLS